MTTGVAAGQPTCRAAVVVAGSVALLAFGLDSLVEVTSAAAVAWQFAASDPKQRESSALRVIAWSFFALATYVTVESVQGRVTNPARSGDRQFHDCALERRYI